MSEKQTPLVRTRRDEGFTLVELLIVVAIIGILAAIAVVNLNDSLNRSRQSKTLANMRNLAQAIQAYESDHSMLPPDGTDAYTLAQLCEGGGLFTNIDPEDGWRNPLVYTANAQQFTLESYASDGADGPQDITPTTKLEFDYDIVLVDGSFVNSPETD